MEVTHCGVLSHPHDTRVPLLQTHQAGGITMEQSQACLPVHNTSHAFVMMSLQLGLTAELQDAYSNQQPQELAPFF